MLKKRGRKQGEEDIRIDLDVTITKNPKGIERKKMSAGCARRKRRYWNTFKMNAPGQWIK